MIECLRVGTGFRLRVRRLWVEVDISMLPRPTFTYENQGPDFHFINFTFGVPGADPITSVTVTL